MRIKGSLIKGLIIALALSVTPVAAVSAQIVTTGAKCKMYQQKINYLSKTYSCIKHGKKLVWSEVLEIVKPTSAPISKPGELKPGLLRADYFGYYEDQLSWFASKKPWQVLTETKIDFQNNTDDNFSIQWTGYFIPTETGKWTFKSTSDDGSGVWIGESAIKQIPENVATLSAPGIHGPFSVSKQKYLEKGYLYPIRILFGDNTNWAQMTLSVQAPSAHSPTLDLQDWVWHSPVSTESNSGIDPQYANSRLLKDSNPNNSQIPNVSDSSMLDSIDFCKLKNINTTGGNGRGFPTSIGRLPTSGKINGIVLFVEFDNLRGADDTQKRFDDYTRQFEAFYNAQSYGKLTINMDFYPKYLHINKYSSAYGMQTHNGGNPWPYLRDALDVADPVVDFSNYDFVVVIPPADIKDIVYGPAFPISAGDDQLRTNEKIIKNATVAGSDSTIKAPYFWLSHEVGHLFGLEHPYSYENVTYSSEVRGIWDLMEIGDPAPEFLSWHRFVLGWLDSSGVSCLNRDSRIGSETIHFISPLEAQDNQIKSVIIRLNDYQAIVVELRRNLGFDTIPEVDEGVVAYKVNVRDIGKVQEVTILTDQPYEKGATIAGNLLPGDKVTDSSVEITVLKSTKAGDYIKVSMLKP